MLLNKRRDVDIESLGENFVDGMRISAEEMMLSLSSFDSEGCSGETRKRIQTLFDHAARLLSSYEKLIELDVEFHNAPSEKKRAVRDKLRREREKSRGLYKTFLANKQSVYTYVLFDISPEKS